MSLLTTITKKYTSPVRCLLASVLRSRKEWKLSCRQVRQQVRELRKQNDSLYAEVQRLGQDVCELRGQNQRLQQRIAECTPQHQWPNLKGHHFSAAMIALYCQLAAKIGFRAVPQVLELISKSFNLDLKIPSRDAIRNWTCRAGVALLQHEKADDWIWMIDHSVQLGKMHVLTVLGIRHSQLPYRQDSASRTVRCEDLHVLAVIPSCSKRKEQVIADLKPLAQRLGTPLAVVCDGASELKAAVESLKTAEVTGSNESLGSGPLHLVDVKHRIASGLKRILSKNEVFEEFSKRATHCAALIRQTELDHLVPPTRKDKCRFMNIHREIRWASMVLSQLDRLSASQCSSAERLRENLGWLLEFRESVNAWRQWCELIGEALTFSNQYGVYRGGSVELERRLLERGVNRSECQQVWGVVVGAYRDNELTLEEQPKSVSCLPCSTELLESAFGRYKAMQRHHNRGTFTTLLAALPTVLHQFSAESIREQFSRVENKDLKDWLHKNDLLNSTQSRRAKAYAAA